MLYLVGVIVGYVVGTLAFPNVVLPLLWSWPKARRLQREGRLAKPIPAAILLLAPLVWGLIVGGSFFIVRAVIPHVSSSYAAGLGASLPQTAWGLISRKDVPQMEAAFAEQWREFFSR